LNREKGVVNLKIFIMSENDPRAFDEYMNSTLARTIMTPVKIVRHELYKWLVYENNHGKVTMDFNTMIELIAKVTDKNGTLRIPTQDEKENIQLENVKKPPYLLMPNTKLSNYLFDKSKNLTALTALVVSGAKEDKVTVKTQVFLSLEEDFGIDLPKNITAYDRAVHDGVCSIIASGTMVATNRQIYEAMTGKTTTSPQALGHVTRSLNKLQRTKIFIDYTQQAKAKGFKGDKMIFKGNLLDFQEVEVTFNKNETTSGYKFLSVPILYKYATEVEQIISVDKELLSGDNITNTDDSIVLRHYLLRRIEAMKNKNNRMTSRKILFDTMFEYCGIKSESREQLRRKRDTVFSMLQGWEKLGYIKGYKECKGDKNKIIGVEIVLPKKK